MANTELVKMKKVCQREGQWCQWFDPYLYSSGSSSAGLTLVENSSCKVFYTQQGHCDWHNV